MGMIALPHTTPAAALCNTGDGPARRVVIYTPLAQQGPRVSRYHIFTAPTHSKTLLFGCQFVFTRWKDGNLPPLSGHATSVSVY